MSQEWPEFDYHLLIRLNCTREEKRTLFPLIDQLLEMAELARRQGLLSLEEWIGRTEERLLKKGLQMVIDGSEPAVIRKILLNYLLCDDKQGRELLKGMLIIDGVLAFQQGLNPQLIRELLLSYLGEDLCHEADEHYFYYRDGAAAVRQFLRELPDNVQYNDNDYTAVFTDVIAGLDLRSLQRVLREVDEPTVCMALIGTGRATCYKILDSLSVHTAVRIVEGLKAMKNNEEQYFVRARKRMHETVMALAGRGEILPAPLLKK